MVFNIDFEDKEILLLLVRKAMDERPEYLRIHEHKLNHLNDEIEDGYEE